MEAMKYNGRVRIIMERKYLLELEKEKQISMDLWQQEGMLLEKGLRMYYVEKEQPKPEDFPTDKEFAERGGIEVYIGKMELQELKLGVFVGTKDFGIILKERLN